MNSVTKGSRPGPEVISWHLTLNIWLPQVCLFNRFVPCWCILLFVQSFIPAHRDGKIYMDQSGNMHSLNPSVLHVHQSFSFSCSQVTSKMMFWTREQKKRSLLSAAQGPDFPLLSTVPEKEFGFTVAQEEHRAAQVLCAPSWSQLKGQQEMRWKVRCMARNL